MLNRERFTKSTDITIECHNTRADLFILESVLRSFDAARVETNIQIATIMQDFPNFIEIGDERAKRTGLFNEESKEFGVFSNPNKPDIDIRLFINPNMGFNDNRILVYNYDGKHIKTIKINNQQLV